MNFRNLPIEVSGNQRLAEQFDTLHLGLDAALAAAPIPNQNQTKPRVFPDLGWQIA